MAIYTDGVVPWNSLDDNTRLPLSSELEGGYPCGPADPELFNWTAGWPIGNIWNMILNAGITPGTDKLLDLARAIQSQKVNYAVAGGTANAITATLAPVPASLTVGMIAHVKISAANTSTTPALNLNGFGAATIVANDGSPLQTNSLVPGLVAGLLWDGTNWRLVSLTASQTPPRNIATYATAGITNFTVPAGIYKIFARVWGGGGGGGGIAGVGNAGGGGGAGGYTEGWFDVVPGQVIVITVGAKGTAGAASNSGSAGTGGTSSFGSYCSAIGGTGGSNGAAAGGAGGTASGGQLIIGGGNGYSGGYIYGNTSLPYGGAGAPAHQQSIIFPSLSGGSISGYGFGSGGSGATSPTGTSAGSQGASGALIIQY